MWAIKYDTSPIIDSSFYIICDAHYHTYLIIDVFSR